LPVGPAGGSAEYCSPNTLPIKQAPGLALLSPADRLPCALSIACFGQARALFEETQRKKRSKVSPIGAKQAELAKVQVWFHVCSSTEVHACGNHETPQTYKHVQTPMRAHAHPPTPRSHPRTAALTHSRAPMRHRRRARAAVRRTSSIRCSPPDRSCSPHGTTQRQHSTSTSKRNATPTRTRRISARS
jgi:hypothetical protein